MADLDAAAALPVSSAHGPGATSALWCRMSDDEPDADSWRALSTGGDGKLVLRAGQGRLAPLTVAGDHCKPSAGLVVAADGKMVVSVEGTYVNVRRARARARTRGVAHSCARCARLPPRFVGRRTTL